MKHPTLTDEERNIYGWQLDVPGFGEEGQRKLKGASVLISRAGGLGGLVAFELAAAGIGRLVIAHGGKVNPGDLNRQLLQTQADLGHPRLPGIERRLKALNPRLELLLVPENANEENATQLVSEADIVVDAAPLFEERYALNQAAVQQRKPMVEAAVYALECTLTTFIPGSTPCLKCLHPERSTEWTRRFPVFGAASGTVACLAAMEVIKLLSGIGKTLAGQLLTVDIGTMEFRRHRLRRDPACSVCATLGNLGGPSK